MKKKFPSSLVMSVLVVLLAAYTIFDYRKAQKEAGFAEDERAAFNLKGESVDTILITRPEESIEIHNQAGEWRMTKPVNDLVDDAGVLAYLYAVASQRVRLFENKEITQGPVDWAKYGLAQPSATIELRSNKETESLSLSSINAFDGSYYVRQDNKLFMGDRGFAQLKDRPASAFRSKLLWRSKELIETAEVQYDDGSGKGLKKFKIFKKDDKWTMDPLPKFALDYGQIDDWMNRVKEFKPAEISKDGFNEEDKSTFLLRKPSFVVRFNNNWELIFGQDRSEDVFLYTNQMPTLYRVSAKGISTIRVGQDFFRDGRKPFEFPVEQARIIEVNLDGKKKIFKKTDTGWANVESGGAAEANQDKLIEFVQTLRGLEAHEYFAKNDPSQTGIALPQVIVKDDKGNALLELSLGKEYKALMAYNNGAALVYARSNLENETFALPKEKVTALKSALKGPP